ncbi:MAG: glycosyltransferase family 39 protein [Nanoarchaeota archaeon]|nr:glycosyltransferase family 39 protein [Nanoarchaeota archaeon]
MENEGSDSEKVVEESINNERTETKEEVVNEKKESSETEEIINARKPEVSGAKTTETKSPSMSTLKRSHESQDAPTRDQPEDFVGDKRGEVKIEDRIKALLKNKYSLILILLMAFVIIIRVYYFFRLGVQPIWWDEGDYLAISKVWAIGQATPEWWGHFTGMRPLLMPIIWAGFFKFGFGELTIRFFTLLIPGIVTTYLVYALGRNLYDKRVGLIASIMMSFYWVWFFYSFRLLTDIPSVFFGMLSLLFFWSYYIKKNKNYGLYLSIVFGVLAFSARFALALVLITIAIYLLFTRKLALFKDKTIWKGVVVFIISIIPYLIFMISSRFEFIRFYFGEEAYSVHQPIAWYIVPMLTSFLHNYWLIALVLGLITLIPLVLGLDVLWKQKSKRLNADFFVVLLLLVHLIFYVVIFRAANDRWLLMLMPPLFYIAAKGVIGLYDILKKYSEIIAIGVLLVLIFGGVYENYNHSIQLTEMKKLTYNEIKLGGEWLKMNSNPDDKIMTASIVQNQYYSERQSYDYFVKDPFLTICTDRDTGFIYNDSCISGMTDLFEKKVEGLKPQYMILSVFEPHFTPVWAYSYPEKHNLTVVQVWAVTPEQAAMYGQVGSPLLIIYKFPE